MSRIEQLATTQHRVVARSQLAGLGVDDLEIDRLAAHGRLHWVLDDVLCLDPEPTWHGRCKAATLQHPGSVIGGLTAAMLHGMIPVDEDEPIHLLIQDGTVMRR